jgi:hypothetical protein
MNTAPASTTTHPTAIPCQAVDELAARWERQVEREFGASYGSRSPFRRLLDEGPQGAHIFSSSRWMRYGRPRNRGRGSQTAQSPEAPRWWDLPASVSVLLGLLAASGLLAAAILILMLLQSA